MGGIDALTVEMGLAYPLAGHYQALGHVQTSRQPQIPNTMVSTRRSLFNAPSSSPIPISGNEEQDNGERHSNYPESQVSVDHDSDSEPVPPSDGGHIEDESDDEEDEDDEESDEEPDRWGDIEETEASIRPYLGVLTSLDRDHNTSLSKHLYSAHLLRRRQLVTRIVPPTASDSSSDTGSDLGPRPKKRQKRVEELVPDSEEDDDKYRFGRGKRFITKTWVSWPHPPSYVPRESEHKKSRLRSQPSRTRFDPGTYSQPLSPPSAPSQMLEETLMATFLRISKDKLLSRPVEETGGAEPAVDDDISQHVLKPVVRHVISQLDGLLTGLYHERGYARALSAEGGAATMTVVSGKAEKKPSPYLLAKSRGSGPKRAITPTTDTGDEGEEEGSNEERNPENDNGEGTPPKKAQKSSRRRRYPAPAPLAKKFAAKRQNRLRLRDWSQLLGVAALTGWEEDALQRTVKRCEEQFNQTMSWRCLREGDHTKQDEIWTGARPKLLVGGGDGAISRDGFMQPINVQKIGTNKVQYKIKIDTPEVGVRSGG